MQANSSSIKQLRQRLREKGLSSKGSKARLLRRLQDAANEAKEQQEISQRKSPQNPGGYERNRYKKDVKTLPKWKLELQKKAANLPADDDDNDYLQQNMNQMHFHHKCNQCEKRFKTKYLLKTHICEALRKELDENGDNSDAIDEPPAVSSEDESSSSDVFSDSYPFGSRPFVSQVEEAKNEKTKNRKKNKKKANLSVSLDYSDSEDSVDVTSDLALHPAFFKDRRKQDNSKEERSQIRSPLTLPSLSSDMSPYSVPERLRSDIENKESPGIDFQSKKHYESHVLKLENRVDSEKKAHDRTRRKLEKQAKKEVAKARSLQSKVGSLEKRNQVLQASLVRLEGDKKNGEAKSQKSLRKLESETKDLRKKIAAQRQDTDIFTEMIAVEREKLEDARQEIELLRAKNIKKKSLKDLYALYEHFSKGLLTVQKTLADKMKEQQEEIKEQTLCKICFDKEIRCLLRPCSHYVVCWECSQNLQICPICRVKIAQRLPVYG